MCNPAKKLQTISAEEEVFRITVGFRSQSTHCISWPALQKAASYVEAFPQQCCEYSSCSTSTLESWCLKKNYFTRFFPANRTDNIFSTMRIRRRLVCKYLFAHRNHVIKSYRNVVSLFELKRRQIVGPQQAYCFCIWFDLQNNARRSKQKMRTQWVTQVAIATSV